jgi:hypothetical protein
MDAWIIWLVAAAVLGVGEMHQGGFYLAPFALGAALAAIVSLLGVGAALSAIVFLLARPSCSEPCVRWPGAIGGCRRRFAPGPLR